MLTDSGILLIYNGRNIPAIGDTSLPEGTYAGGQVLMDRNDPTRVIHRLEHYFIRPQQPYEITDRSARFVSSRGWPTFTANGFCTTEPPTRRSRVAVK